VVKGICNVIKSRILCRKATDLPFYSPTFGFLMRGCHRAAGTPSSVKIILGCGAAVHKIQIVSPCDILPSLDLKFKEQEGAGLKPYVKNDIVMNQG
jgi:hypothetical protein